MLELSKDEYAVISSTKKGTPILVVGEPCPMSALFPDLFLSDVIGQIVGAGFDFVGTRIDGDKRISYQFARPIDLTRPHFLIGQCLLNPNFSDCLERGGNGT